MTSDPEQIRAEITRFLAGVPDPEQPGADIEAIAARLEEAHDLLVGALEAVERTPSSGAPTGS
jgi:hypothetical protein